MCRESRSKASQGHVHASTLAEISKALLNLEAPTSRRPQNTMAVSILRRFLLPSVRLPISIPKIKPQIIPSIARNFSSTPTPFATYNQVVKVLSTTNPAVKFRSSNTNLYIIGLPQSATRPKSCVPRSARRSRTRTERRLSKSRDHQAEETQFR
jgi:hypothetical protein